MCLFLHSPALTAHRAARHRASRRRRCPVGVMSFEADALDRYEAARDRAVSARETWEAEGSFFTVVYTNNIEAVNPLLRVVVEAEKHADALLRSLVAVKAKPGRPPGTQSAPDRGPARRSKLKVVEGG